jgi:hypothetical protein
MTENRFPPGWDEGRVQKSSLATRRNRREAVAEDEAAFERSGQTVMEVPSGSSPPFASSSPHRR